MSLIHDLLRRGPRDPSPDPDFARRKRRTVLKAALQGLTTPFKNYVNYAAFPDRIPQTADKETHDKVIRRAVHYTNAQLGIQGLVRGDFDKEMNDRLARNAVYALCEKGVVDYFGTAEWEIVNEKGDQRVNAMKQLARPNPHQTFGMVMKESVRDTTRYDAGVIVNSLTADGYLGELRAFHGPDFWIEVDRDWTALEGIGSQYYGPWSHGMVKRYWQHSRPGIYIPFEPKEICYFMLYPRTDSMYGTDFLARVRWQLEYLIDSTRSAGMTYANGIAPGAVWKHPDYTSIEELAERELDIELNHLGPENFGGILHLIGNESLESFTPTLHDMEWIEGQRFFTEMVLAMFGFSSSEFFQGDMNRATAYIGRNITKSRMLYPLQVHYQNMITTKILPLMEGWEDDWVFQFCDTVDLDDELKRAQINQTKASTASSYAMLGLSVESALELAEVDDDLRTAVKEDLDALKEQEGSWTDGLPEELSPDQAEQYYGDPGGEDYEGTAVDGDDAEDREDDDGIEKAARIYLNQGEEPPKGVQVKTGPRGGRYYTSETGRQKVTPGHKTPGDSPLPVEGEEGAGSDDPTASRPDYASQIARAIDQDFRRLYHGYVPEKGKVVDTGETGFYLDPKTGETVKHNDYKKLWPKIKADGPMEDLIMVHSHGPMNWTPGGPFEPVSAGDIVALQWTLKYGYGKKSVVIMPDGRMEALSVEGDGKKLLALSKKAIYDYFKDAREPEGGREALRTFAKEYGLTYEEGLTWKDPDVQKARIYLHQGEEPPAGVRVQRGPRGGQYYEARAIEAGQQSPPAGSQKTDRKPLTPPERPWEMETPDQIPWREGDGG